MYPHPNQPTDVAQTATERLIAALNDPDAMFTRDQALFLLTTGQRWGYEARVDEENSAPDPEPVFVAGGWMDQVDYRRQCDEAARLPRPNDFKGGLPMPETHTTKEMAA